MSSNNNFRNVNSANSDEMVNINKYNDMLLNSNLSNKYNIANILKMYADELQSVNNDHKSNCSRIQTEELLRHITEQSRENTYLTNILSPNDLNGSTNENNILSMYKNLLRKLSTSPDEHVGDGENVNDSFFVASMTEIENLSQTPQSREERDSNGVVGSSLFDGSQNQMYCRNNVINGCGMWCAGRHSAESAKDIENLESETNNSNVGLNEFSDSQQSVIIDQRRIMRNPFMCCFNKSISQNSFMSHLSNNTISSSARNGLIDNGSISDGPVCAIEHVNSNLSMNLPVAACQTQNDANYRNLGSIQELPPMGSHQSNCKGCYSKDKLIVENTIDALKTKYYSSNKNSSESLNNKYTVTSEYKKSDTLLMPKKYNSENIISSLKNTDSENKTNDNQSDIIEQRKLKCYSLDDIRNKKVEMPNIIFTKLPVAPQGHNVIDSYVKNNKLQSFMRDCNNSVSLILKYPKIEKTHTGTFKVPVEMSASLRSNIGMPIVYEDTFDRNNYHPVVKNLHMGKIFERHVFSMIKNKKELGQDVIKNNDKNKKFNYNDNDGFWISNIDKNRLKNYTENSSYVTELVYEKENSYDDEMDKLKNCENFDIIPPLSELYKGNDFYNLLKNERIQPGVLKPAMATIMRRYDIEDVSNYKKVSSSESITPVHN